MGIAPGHIKSILDTEDSYIRFERFCLEVFSEEGGVPLVPTSKTWDMGRDGRSVSALSKGRATLCASLERDIDDKVRSDIRRVARTTQSEILIYCTPRFLSEQKCNDIEAVIRAEYDSVETVHILGQVQLISLAEQHESVFRKHYAAEITNLERTLLNTPSTLDRAEDIGLRLALLTHETDDAEALRRELAARLVLDVLGDGIPRTPSQIAASITAVLHLPRTVSDHYMRELLSQLGNEGLVSAGDALITLTELGRDKINTVEEQATAKLLEGRVAVRDAIHKLTGNRLTDDHFNQLWNSFQDGITGLFYSHGLAIVKMMRSALREEQWKPEKARLEIPLEQLADRVVHDIREPQLKEEIHQAIIDMFFERGSAAFHWLTQVCGIYVMMCSLGFETLSGEQILKTLACYCLMPDSDIVLSLLCTGEDNHDDVEMILSGWKAVGGKLFAVRPVLEEVAYHAWISEHDYGSFGESLAQLSDEQARRLIDNAFVRAFRKEAAPSTDHEHWEMYIEGFKGRSEYDYGYILEHLTVDHGFGWIAEDTEVNAEFGSRVTKFLVSKLCDYNRCAPQGLGKKTLDKTTRDSRLLTALYRERQSAHMSGEPRTYCIVTSARALREADEAFRDELGEPEGVVSLAALGFLLSLVPQVQMSFGVLRSILFDTYLATRLTPIQRLACRAIAASGHWEMPWAKRGTLRRRLRQTILQQARLTGEKAAQVTDRVLRVEDPEFSAQVVATALDRMAIGPSTEGELRRLRSEVEKMREEKPEQKREERPHDTRTIELRPKDAKRFRARKRKT